LYQSRPERQISRDRHTGRQGIHTLGLHYAIDCSTFNPEADSATGAARHSPGFRMNTTPAQAQAQKGCSHQRLCCTYLTQSISLVVSFFCNRL